MSDTPCGPKDRRPETPEEKQIRLARRRELYAERRATGWKQPYGTKANTDPEKWAARIGKSRKESYTPEAWAALVERRRPVTPEQREKRNGYHKAYRDRRREAGLPNDYQKRKAAGLPNCHEKRKAAGLPSYSEARKLAGLPSYFLLRGGRTPEEKQQIHEYYKARMAAGLIRCRKEHFTREEWLARLEKRRLRGYTPRKPKPLRKFQDRYPGCEPIKRLALNDPTYAAIWKHIGGGIERDEIASEAYLALLEGDVATVADAVTLGRKRHYRMFTLKNMSMDAPRFDDSTQTLHDIIAAYVPEVEDDADPDDASEPDIHVGDLGSIMLAAFRRSEAVRQSA